MWVLVDRDREGRGEERKEMDKFSEIKKIGDLVRDIRVWVMLQY